MAEELKQFRSLRTKFYDNGHSHLYIGPVHYNNKLGLGDGVKGWRELDWTLLWDDLRKGWSFQYNFYHPFIPEYADDWAEFRDLNGEKDQTTKIRAVSAGHVKGVLTEPKDCQEASFGFNCVVYKDAFDIGVDLIYGLSRSGLRKIIRFRSYPTIDGTYSFEIQYPLNKKVYCCDVGEDISTQNEVDMTKTFDREDAKWMFIGDSQGTIIKPVWIWDQSKITKRERIKERHYVKNEKHFFDKIIPVSFFFDAVGNVLTDAALQSDVTTGDGKVYNTGDATWAGCRDAATGDGADDSGNDPNVTCYKYANYGLVAYWCPFPLTDAGLTGATITACTLHCWAYANGYNTGSVYDYLSLVEGNQANTASLSTGDFDARQFTEFSDDHPDPGIILLDDEITFDFNTAGLSYLNNQIGNYAKLCITTGYDVNDSAPGTSEEINQKIRSADAGGNTPYLEITHITLISGQINASVSVSGSLSVTKELTGQVSVNVSTNGVLSVSRELSGQTNVSVSISGSLEVAKSLSGQVDVGTSITGTLIAAISLSGQINVDTSITGMLGVEKELSGQTNVTVSIVGTLSIEGQVSLSGQINAVVVTSGFLEVQKQLTATIQVGVSTAGQLIVTKIVSGSIVTTVALTGSLEATRALVGSIDVNASLFGTLIGQWALSGAINVGVNITGTLGSQVRPVWMIGCNVGALNTILTRM